MSGPPRRRIKREDCLWLYWPTIRRWSPWVKHTQPFYWRQRRSAEAKFWIEPASIIRKRPIIGLHIETPCPEHIDVYGITTGIQDQANFTLLVCPNCGRGIRKLYCTPQPDSRWGCFKCLDLSYRCESQSKDDRLLDAMWKIDDRLKRKTGRKLQFRTRIKLRRKRAQLENRRNRLFLSNPLMRQFLEDAPMDSFEGQVYRDLTTPADTDEPI